MRSLLTITLLALAGCQRPGIEWNQPASAPGDTLGALVLDGGELRFVEADSALTPPDSAACPGTVASASDRGVRFSAWLRKRPDSSVVVMAARWDGTQWSAPAIVDSIDVGTMGCKRPAPSIAVGNEDGYIHVAYSMRAPEGFGVFFAHSMDRGSSFHWPVIVVYGDRLVSTATAAHGMKVVVAYEEPSGAVERVRVAFSRTQGHSFEPREEGSPDELVARRPRVALNDSLVALTFAGADSTRRAMRIGRLK